MTFTPRTPSFADVISAALDARLQDVHVALPARVESFDAARQLADVQPLLLQPLIGEDGTQTTARLPVIPSVPVVFPRGGGFSMTFPLNVGDNVMVVFVERSLDVWKGQGGEVNPVDRAFHSFGGAVCYPGLYPATSPVPNFATNKVVIGKDGLAHSPAARKNDAVKVTIPALTVVTSVTGGGGSPAVGVLNASPIDVTGTITAGSGNVDIGD